ncbi:MAG: tautomerase family protein [Sulfuricurvum sp.]|uniref:tautomerase family protein n=1 Tax=Sulfuricurvum sp. TaxID=2025608 RepID=UPI002623D2A0|nr:tautomerase family protein [Sulfuricurvum sp.]MDD2830428.1 tautomerase family protein [Sulfuricurvum sp.]MDD4950819.1 tautomerase family protein [Sulfuricurvum sp.]
MAQIKIYGLKNHIVPIREHLSDIIHNCVVEALSFPIDKRAHRFFPMEREDWYAPEGRTEAYTIIEITMMSGRSVESRKKLIKLLFANIENQLGVSTTDIEICILESPPVNWGFRGQCGDEIKLNYKIEV